VSQERENRPQFSSFFLEKIKRFERSECADIEKGGLWAAIVGGNWHGRAYDQRPRHAAIELFCSHLR
jgi:hypothetical protein